MVKIRGPDCRIPGVRRVLEEMLRAVMRMSAQAGPFASHVSGYFDPIKSCSSRLVESESPCRCCVVQASAGAGFPGDPGEVLATPSPGPVLGRTSRHW